MCWGGLGAKEAEEEEEEAYNNNMPQAERKKRERELNNASWEESWRRKGNGVRRAETTNGAR